MRKRPNRVVAFPVVGEDGVCRKPAGMNGRRMTFLANSIMLSVR